MKHVSFQCRFFANFASLHFNTRMAVFVRSRSFIFAMGWAAVDLWRASRTLSPDLGTNGRRWRRDLRYTVYLKIQDGVRRYWCHADVEWRFWTITDVEWRLGTITDIEDVWSLNHHWCRMTSCNHHWCRMTSLNHHWRRMTSLNHYWHRRRLKFEPSLM